MNFILVLVHLIGWLFFTWAVADLIALGVFWSELFKTSFIPGPKPERMSWQKGWRKKSLKSIALIAVALTIWHHLVFIWTITSPALGPTVLP